MGPPHWHFWTSKSDALRSRLLKQFLKSEAGATVLWAVASLVLAALIAPWLYVWGKSLGEMAAVEELPGLLEWLGAACKRSDFQRYFSRALVIAAVVLLPFLFCRVRGVWVTAGGISEPGTRPSWTSAWVQMAVGCVVAGGILWATGMLLAMLGAYVLKPQPMAWNALAGKVAGAAAGASLLEEWLFRGLLLGLWLRFARPLAACVGTSLFFSFIHFLKLPAGAVIADPTTALAGFEFLREILLHFTEPLFFVADFTTLFVVGMILSQARLRTGALWFPIGLHAGWIIAFKSFHLRYVSVAGNLLHPWGVGETLRSGLVPMLALGLTAVICHFILRRFEPVQASH